MIFSLEALRAKHGDSLLLHYGPPDEPRLMIIDGGPSGVFNHALRPRLEELKEERGEESLRVDLLMVSHIDDVVGHGAERLETAAREGISTASTTDDVPAAVLRDHPGALVLASVQQGRQLRGDAEVLGLSVNRGDGGLIVARGGGEDEVDFGQGLKLLVLGPLGEQVDRFQEEWDRQIEKLGVARPAGVEAAAYVDESVFNLASIVVLAQAGDKTMLLTGDARGDYVLQGLQQAGLLEEGGTFHVDLLKLPHHGSDRNVETDFFRRVTADHYVVSGDGRYGNPEIATFQMIFAARGDEPFTLHLTYPPEEMEDDYPSQELAELFARQRQAGKPFEVVTAEEGGSLLVELLEPAAG